MAFKQYVRAEIAAGLDETHQFEGRAADPPGRGYYEDHLAVIRYIETCTPTLTRFLDGSGKRILESGCGTGRWMAFFETLGHTAVGVDDSAGPLRVAHAHDPRLRLVMQGELVVRNRRSQIVALSFSNVSTRRSIHPGKRPAWSLAQLSSSTTC